MNKLYKANYDIFLLSSSPRRQNFFKDLGFDFRIMKPMEEESPAFENEQASAYVLRVAENKALYGLNHMDSSYRDKNYVIIAADTVVNIDKEILGKPKDNADAFRMLKLLSGKKHIVTTAVSIIEKLEHENRTSFAVNTEVTFSDWSDEVLQAYANCGEPLDKAGAYAIQGRGSFLVSSINGCWTNVVGLPLSALVDVLLKNSLISPIRY